MKRILFWIAFLSVQLTTVLGVVLTWILLSVVFFRKKLSKHFFYPILILSGIFLIGFLSGLFHRNFEHSYLFFKDLAYFLRPIIGLTLGYFLFKTFGRYSLNLIVQTALISAFIHAIMIVVYILQNGFSNLFYIRTFAGLQNDFEILGFILLLFRKPLQIEVKYYWFKLIFILISLIFYFSRINFIEFVVYFLALKGFFRISIKSIFIFVILIFLTFLTYNLILLYNPKRDSKQPAESFLYKVKNIPDEVFNPNVDTLNHRYLWDRWRAYEAYRAIRGVTQDETHQIFFGKGAGRNISIGFEVNINGQKFKSVPHIHNGFAYVFFKTGLIGLFLYLIFFGAVLLISNNHTCYEHRLLTAITIIIFLNTFVITGLYNLKESNTLIMGIMIGLALATKNTHENSYSGYQRDT